MADIKKALQAFGPVREHLDRYAVTVLDRLGADNRAIEAFATFEISPKAAESIVLACIEAESLARTFEATMKAENEMLGSGGKIGRLDRLDKAVRDLRQFFDELTRKPPDRLAATVSHSDEDVGAAKQGLYLLENAISARRQVAQETVLRLGGTRKKKDRGKAGATAAIGWIAEGVERRCGRPYLNATADLAAVVLRCEVSLDRVRAARKTRQRAWRK